MVAGRGVTGVVGGVLQGERKAVGAGGPVVGVVQGTGVRGAGQVRVLAWRRMRVMRLGGAVVVLGVGRRRVAWGTLIWAVEAKGGGGREASGAAGAVVVVAWVWVPRLVRRATCFLPRAVAVTITIAITVSAVRAVVEVAGGRASGGPRP